MDEARGNDSEEREKKKDKEDREQTTPNELTDG